MASRTIGRTTALWLSALALGSGGAALAEDSCAVAYGPGGQFDRCVTRFYDKDTYGWLSVQNNCQQAIYVVYTSTSGKPGLNGAADIPAGKKHNTGNSPKEIDSHGGLSLAICPAKSIPVDATGNYWHLASTAYRCKPEGAPRCQPEPKPRPG